MHEPERRRALETLRLAYEEEDVAFPADYVHSLWEELAATWREQLREKWREVRRILGLTRPRREDIKTVALAPAGPTGSAWLTFPN
eukprot:4089609-Pyramimonas_sp.AAC.1